LNQVYKIISILSKEECRNFNILSARTNNSSERKDVSLFNYARKNNFLEDDSSIIEKLYDKNDDSSKNTFYRLKNRLFNDLNRSLLFLHYNRSDYFAVLNSIHLSKIMYEKGDQYLTIFYLKQAESKSIKNEFYDLLDLVYNDFIHLAIESVQFNPAEYIEKRKKNREILLLINKIDDFLAELTYKIKTTQNYDWSKDNDLEQQAFFELVSNTKISNSVQLQLKIYNSISRILLQKHDYIGLEGYLKTTFIKFLKNKIFNKSNHDTKLQMLTYLVNSLFKNEKIEESLSYTKKLLHAMNEFNGFLYGKYLFYYYNALVINYQVNDKQQAIAILEEAKTKKEIQQLSIFNLFIYLNLAVLHFDLNQFSKSKSALVKLKMDEKFKNLDEFLRYKINIIELMIVFELNDIDLFDYQLNRIKKEFEILRTKKEADRDNAFLQLLEKIEYLDVKELTLKVDEFVQNYNTEASSDADIINYSAWLLSKTKKGGN